VDPVLGSLVYQLPGGVTLAYDLRLGRTIARWKGIVEEIHLGDIIEKRDPEKPSFRTSKWPWKLKDAKNSKLPKLPKNCFQLEKVGRHRYPKWPVRNHPQVKLLRNFL
jgi:hypothetical protein